MTTTSWCDAEDNALQGLTVEAQIIYLRLIRRRMNFATGISGHEQRITELCMRQVIEYAKPWGSNQRPSPPPTRDYIRSRVEELERAGLIERISTPGRMIFRCILASTDQCAQKRNARGTPEERPEEDPENTSQVIDGKEKEKKEHTEEKQRRRGGAPSNPVSGIRNNTITGSNSVNSPKVPTVTVEQLIADGLQQETAAELLAHKARWKTKLTPLVWRQLKREFASAGLTAEDGVIAMITLGWRGFRAEWYENKVRSKAQPPPRPAKFDPSAYVNRNRTSVNDDDIINGNAQRVDFG